MKESEHPFVRFCSAKRKQIEEGSFHQLRFAAWEKKRCNEVVALTWWWRKRQSCGVVLQQPEFESTVHKPFSLSKNRFL